MSLIPLSKLEWIYAFLKKKTSFLAKIAFPSAALQFICKNYVDLSSFVSSIFIISDDSCFPRTYYWMPQISLISEILGDFREEKMTMYGLLTFVVG